LGWRFPADVITAAFKISNRRPFKFRKLFTHFGASENAIIDHGELKAKLIPSRPQYVAQMGALFQINAFQKSLSHLNRPIAPTGKWPPNQRDILSMFTLIVTLRLTGEKRG
jgi:hypothetical protein